MEYNFREIEKKWHEYWIANKVYKVEKNADKPKYYVLDMFPYPSGAGLHVCLLYTSHKKYGAC